MSGITKEGMQIKTYDEIVASLELKFKQRFGESFDTTAESPDGMNIRIMAEYLESMYQLAEKAYHAYNPRMVEGVGLDNLVALNGIKRIMNEPTKVGLVFFTIDAGGDILPKGTVCKSNVDGLEFVTLSDLVLPGQVLAECTTPGAIRIQPDEITEIVDSPFPDLSVSNPEAGITGIIREEDPQLRARRERSVIRAGTATAEAIYQAVADLNLEFIAVLENDTDTERNGIPPHSFLTVAEGSTIPLIAERLYHNSTIGIQAYGEHKVEFVDSEGYKHIIGVSRPEKVDIHVKIELHRPSNVAINRLRQIRESLAAYINTMQIAQPVEWSKMFAPATLAAPDVNIKQIWISTDGINWGFADIIMGPIQRAQGKVSLIEIEEI